VAGYGHGLPKRMPEMMTGAPFHGSMMEMFGLPKPSASKNRSDSKQPDPSDNRDSKPNKKHK
jgi:hypothetical protein